MYKIIDNDRCEILLSLWMLNRFVIGESIDPTKNEKRRKLVGSAAGVEARNFKRSSSFNSGW